MRHRPLLAGAAALALALSLAACGDDGDDESTDTTEASADSADDTSADTETDDTEAETNDTEAETDDTEDTTAETDDTEAVDLTSLLVTAEDVGETFTEQPYETSSEPGPCGIDLDVDYPFDAIVGTVLVDEALGLAMQHELRTYADEATAAGLVAAAQDSFACGADTTTEGLVLGEVTDVAEDVGAESAFLVSSTNETDGSEGGIVVVQVGSVLSVYQFQGPGDVEDGPDPLSIVSTNVATLQAELG